MNNSEIENLAGHFEGVEPGDLLLIAFHDGVSYSVAAKGYDFWDIDAELTAALKKHIAHGEFVARLSQTGRHA